MDGALILLTVIGLIHFIYIIHLFILLLSFLFFFLVAFSVLTYFLYNELLLINNLNTKSSEYWCESQLAVYHVENLIWENLISFSSVVKEIVKSQHSVVSYWFHSTQFLLSQKSISSPFISGQIAPPTQTSKVNTITWVWTCSLICTVVFKKQHGHKFCFLSKKACLYAGAVIICWSEGGKR